MCATDSGARGTRTCAKSRGMEAHSRPMDAWTIDFPFVSLHRRKRRDANRVRTERRSKAIGRRSDGSIETKHAATRTSARSPPRRPLRDPEETDPSPLRRLLHRRSDVGRMDPSGSSLSARVLSRIVSSVDPPRRPTFHGSSPTRPSCPEAMCGSRQVKWTDPPVRAPSDPGICES